MPDHWRQAFGQTSPVVLVISVGGMLGAAARHGADLLIPVSSSGFPWATFAVNLSGCALIGVLMVIVAEGGGGHRLLRPFVGVGVLGGYTTFSTYAVEIQRLLTLGRPTVALAYLIGTVVGAMLAVVLGVIATRTGIRLLGRLRGRMAARRKEPT